jgi:hypothetical protein
MPWRHIGGWRYSSTTLDLHTVRRWTISFTPRPLCPQGNSPWYPLEMRMGGPQVWSGSCRKKIILHSRELNLGHAAHSSSLYQLSHPDCCQESCPCADPDINLEATWKAGWAPQPVWLQWRELYIAPPGIEQIPWSSTPRPGHYGNLAILALLFGTFDICLCVALIFHNVYLRFEIHIAMTIKIIVFWGVMLCGLADCYWCFRGT